jgi:hypothetical protein
MDNMVDALTILKTSMDAEENDAGADTIGDYLVELLSELWREEEGFSGKRPFGNSGWTLELVKALVVANLIDGEIDEDGYLDSYDDVKANELIALAISSIGVLIDDAA